MSETRPGDVTQMLLGWGKGDREALDGLMPAVYKELRRLAQSYLRQERPDHSLQATELVNEAYLRMVDAEHRHVDNRAQFFAVAAQAMRRILIDHARKKRANKRGGGTHLVTLDEERMDGLGEPANAVDVLALDDALRDLAQQDERQAKVVELKYFGGLTLQETAKVLHLSTATVSREWNMARAWLRRDLRHRAK